MIDTLSLRDIGSKRMLNYATTFHELVAQAQIEDADTQAMMLRLQQSNTHLHELINKTGSELLTQQIAEADEEQDLSFQILRDKVELEVLKSRRTKNPNASLIMEAIRNSGYSLHHFSYKAQEDALTTLLETFEKDEAISSAITDLKIEALVNDLQKDFNTFRELRKTKHAQGVGKAKHKDLKVVRTEILELIHHITQRLNSMVYANPGVNQFLDLAATLEKHNDSYRIQFKMNATRRANENEARGEDDSNYGAEFGSGDISEE